MNDYLVSQPRGRSALALALAPAVVLLVAACGNGTADPEATTTAPPATIAVSTAEATVRDLPVMITTTGSFSAGEVSEVAAQTAGAVVATPVDVGARVRRGQTIVRLDVRDAELRLDQARAAQQQAEAALAQARERHALAQANAARYQSLVKTGDVSKSLQEQAAAEEETTRQAMTTAQAAIADARARVAIVQKALADTTIVAPFDGFVTERMVAVGEYVAPGTHVATVMNLDPIRLRLQVPERQSARIAVGQRVVAQVEALGNLAVEGRITAVSAALDPATRAVQIEAQVPNPNGRIRAAMFATAQMALPQTEQAVFVPRDAILPDPNTNSSRVFVIEGDVARMRVVQPGPAAEGEVRIISGVTPGERVATSGLSELFDGAQVTAAVRATRN